MAITATCILFRPILSMSRAPSATEWCGVAYLFPSTSVRGTVFVQPTFSLHGFSIQQLFLEDTIADDGDEENKRHHVQPVFPRELVDLILCLVWYNAIRERRFERAAQLSMLDRRMLRMVGTQIVQSTPVAAGTRSSDLLIKDVFNTLRTILEIYDDVYTPRYSLRYILSPRKTLGMVCLHASPACNAGVSKCTPSSVVPLPVARSRELFEAPYRHLARPCRLDGCLNCGYAYGYVGPQTEPQYHRLADQILVNHYVVPSRTRDQHQRSMPVYPQDVRFPVVLIQLLCSSCDIINDPVWKRFALLLSMSLNDADVYAVTYHERSDLPLDENVDIVLHPLYEVERTTFPKLGERRWLY